MDIPQKFQEFLEDTGLSMEMLRYGGRLLNVIDELNKHQELYDIKSINDLSNQTAEKVRKFAQCIGIHHSHGGYKKDKLIKMIESSHATLTQQPVPQETTLIIEESTSVHETRIQRHLNIGEPISFENDQYYELEVIREMYADYPVQFVEKKDKTVLKFKTMETFFCNIIIDLFLKHYRCFKYIDTQLYMFSNDEWIPVFPNTINQFVMHCYGCLVSLAEKINADLSDAFGALDADISNRNIILKRAARDLLPVIKRCT